MVLVHGAVCGAVCGALCGAVCGAVCGALCGAVWGAVGGCCFLLLLLLLLDAGPEGLKALSELRVKILVKVYSTREHMGCVRADICMYPCPRHLELQCSFKHLRTQLWHTEGKHGQTFKTYLIFRQAFFLMGVSVLRHVVA